MSKLKLTLACDQYDYLQPLRDGTVKADGIDLNLLTVESSLRHQRMNRYGEYDACEFSTGSHLAACANGIDWLQALPFFPRRMFCHRFIFVRSDSGIEKPSDLIGRRIGLIAYQNSLAIAVKGMLSETYGIPANQATWVTMREDAVRTAFPSDIKVEQAAPGSNMEELLLAGEIDAMVEPNFPKSWLNGSGKVRRLFPTYELEEKTYYTETGLFPIMHHIAVKKEILDQHPWVATSLYEALLRARNAYDDFMLQPHRLSFAWANAESEKAFFGKSPFYQGFKENRNDLDSMIRFAYEQGIINRQLSANELFAENTLGT